MILHPTLFLIDVTFAAAAAAAVDLVNLMTRLNSPTDNFNSCLLGRQNQYRYKT